MKITSVIGKLIPRPGSQAKIRDRLFEITRYEAETDEEDRQLVQGHLPEAQLSAVIERAAEVLSRPGKETVEHTSVKYHATQAKKWAEVALEKIESGQEYNAIRYSMWAVREQWLMTIADLVEPGAAASRDSRRKESKKKKWAEKLAEHLAKNDRSRSFEEISNDRDLWMGIESEGIKFAGYEVWRTDNGDGDLKASKGDHTDPPLSMNSFYTGYFSPARQIYPKNKKS